MADRIEEVQVLLQVRNIRSHGPMASAQINSMQSELVHDLAAISDQWNNRLVPLTAGLPDGTDDSDVDAFLNGLDGKHLYVDQRATATINPSYFNSSNNRPNTLFEQLTDVYSDLSGLREDLEGEIAGLTGQASQISVEDTGNLYTSINVETALAEVMTEVNGITLVGVTPDLSAVNEHYLPALDNTYDIGSPTYRMRDVYVGPGSFTVIAKSALAEAPTDKVFAFEIDSVTGKLQLLDGATITLEADSTAVTSRQTFKTNTISQGPASDTITVDLGSAAGSIFSTTGVKTVTLAAETTLTLSRSSGPSVVLNSTDIELDAAVGVVKVIDSNLVVEHVSGTKGAFVTAKMNTAERNTLTPLDGMIIYNETTSGFEGYDGTTWGSLGGGGGGSGIIGAPDDGDYDTGLSGILAADNIATAVDKLDEFVAVVAAVVAPPPGNLSSQDLGIDVTEYSGTLPNGLAGSWVDAGGTAVSTVVYTDTYVLSSPDISSRFLAGDVLTGQSSAGQLTHVLNVIDGQVHNIATNGVGSTGVTECTALTAHNAIFQRANGQINYVQPAEGKARHRLKHTQAGQTNEKTVYYDDAATAPTFSVAPSHSVAAEVTRYLSGVQYYIGGGTTFNVSFTAAAGIYQKVYRSSGVARIEMSGGGATNLDVDPGATPNVNDTFPIVNEAFSISAAGIVNNTPVLSVRLRKPNGQDLLTASGAVARKIGLTADQSTTIAEYFTDEAQRVVIGTTNAWTPANILVDGNAQVFNGSLVHPVVGDYAGFVAAGQEYQRQFTKVSASNGTIVFSGISYTDIDPYGTGGLNVLLQLDGDSQWFDLGRVVGDNNGDASGDSRANSKGSRSSGSSSTVNFSFLTWSTGGGNNNKYRVVVIFRSTNDTITQMVSS